MSISRYGEPFYSERPTSKEDGTWIVALPASDESYEELELEKRLKKSVSPSLGANIRLAEEEYSSIADHGASLATRNPLAILAGPDSTVKILVGSTPWHIHEALLVSHSSFFKSALYDAKHKLVLAEHQATAFTLFVQYLYTSTFDPPSPTDSVAAYILGEIVGATAFKNKAIDKLHALNLWKRSFIPVEARTIITCTKVGCGLRRLAMDSIALGFLTQVLDVQAEEWKMALDGKEVMVEVMASMARQYSQTWKSKAQCEYHDSV